MNSANTFLRTLFFGTPSVAASVKAYNFTKIRRVFFVNFLNIFGAFSLMRCKNFLKVHKNTGKNMFVKYLPADDCFVKTMTLLTAMITTMLSVSFHDSRAFAFTRQPMKRNFT